MYLIGGRKRSKSLGMRREATQKGEQGRTHSAQKKHPWSQEQKGWWVMSRRASCTAG
jgi:hypothetical protein